VEDAGAYLHRAIVDDYREPRAWLQAQIADRQATARAERERSAGLELAKRRDASVKAERDRGARAAWLERLPAAEHTRLMESAARRAAAAPPAMREIQTRIEFAQLVSAAFAAGSPGAAASSAADVTLRS